MKRRILALAAVACFGRLASAHDVKPHALFSDGMVLQQGMKCPIWGMAEPGEQVSVSYDISKNFARAAAAAAVTADDKGKWKVTLQFSPELAGGPYTLTIKGKNTITLKDVYVGEVWVCSGQSNMEMRLSDCYNPAETIKNANNPKIRLFTVPKHPSDRPVHGFKGDPKWVECNADTVPSFSGVAYYFGRDLQKARNVPIGLIHTSWGGTRAEAWTSRPVLESHEEWKNESINYHQAVEKYNEAAKEAKEKGGKAAEESHARQLALRTL